MTNEQLDRGISWARKTEIAFMKKYNKEPDYNKYSELKIHADIFESIRLMLVAMKEPPKTHTEAKVEFTCPCSPDSKIVADPMFVKFKEEDNFYVECCQCGTQYELVGKKKDYRTETVIPPLSMFNEKGEHFLDVMRRQKHTTAKPDPIREVYKTYKDKAFGVLGGATSGTNMFRDMWKAIKEYNEAKGGE